MSARTAMAPASAETKPDLIVRLLDLQKQATVERSHFYVGALCVEAAAEVTRLRKQIDQLAAPLREILNLCALGDVDEGTEALGWGKAIKAANAAIAKVQL